MVPTVFVCVEELNTRSRVQFSTPYNKFHSYSAHAQVTIRIEQSAHDSNIDPTINRNRHSGRVHANASYSCVHLGAYVMFKPPSVLNH